MKQVFTICLLMLTISTFAQVEKHLDSVINSSILQNEPGIALYVENQGKVIYKKGFGLADTERSLKISPKTNFRLASVSKQFTAMCILLLEKDNKLSLDDPISKFFPEIPKQIGSKILLRHLMTHTSGIVDYEEVMDESPSYQLLDSDALNLLKDQDTTYIASGSWFMSSVLKFHSTRNTAHYQLLRKSDLLGKFFENFEKDSRVLSL